MASSPTSMCASSSASISGTDTSRSRPMALRGRPGTSARRYRRRSRRARCSASIALSASGGAPAPAGPAPAAPDIGALGALAAAAGTVAAAVAAAGAVAASARCSAASRACRRSRRQPSRSASRRALPITVSFSCGRSASALATRSSCWRARASSRALPGAKATCDRSSPAPPSARASRVKGAVMALPIRLKMALTMTGPSENWGSLSEPLMGRSRSITPLLSDSSAVARRTGRLAGAPATGSPNCS